MQNEQATCKPKTAKTTSTEKNTFCGMKRGCLHGTYFKPKAVAQNRAKVRDITEINFGEPETLENISVIKKNEWTNVEGVTLSEPQEVMAKMMEELVEMDVNTDLEVLPVGNISGQMKPANALRGKKHDGETLQTPMQNEHATCKPKTAKTTSTEKNTSQFGSMKRVFLLETSSKPKAVAQNRVKVRDITEISVGEPETLEDISVIKKNERTNVEGVTLSEPQKAMAKMMEELVKMGVKTDLDVPQVGNMSGQMKPVDALRKLKKQKHDGKTLQTPVQYEHATSKPKTVQTTSTAEATSQFGGMKRGFLLGPSCKRKAVAQNRVKTHDSKDINGGAHETLEDIPVMKQYKRNVEGVSLSEAQEAMDEMMEEDNATSMSDYYSNLSLHLCEIMNTVGASEEMRRHHQNTAMTRDIILTMCEHLNNRHISRFIFGSHCEGTTTPGLHSDIDMLHCMDDYPVIENIRDAPGGLSFLMIRDNHTQPGYVKLQVVFNGLPRTVYNADITDRVDSDHAGRICWKHNSAYGVNDNINERNGPADTIIRGDIAGDAVPANRCTTIPACAREWITRPRQHGWPTRQMIDQMRRSGCFVVGVGHPSCNERHIEWRLSFSLQERLLMLNMSPSQHNCYIFLKIIKKDLIQSTVGTKSISSYHCKTCLLHVIENTRADIWRPENIYQCVRLCLLVLLKFVFDGYCPNYFIKEENMFDRDFQRHVQSRLIDVLRTLITNGPTMLLHIQCDQIGDILMGQGDVYAIEDTTQLHKTKLNIHTIIMHKTLRNEIYSLLNRNSVYVNCLFLLRFVHDLTNIKNFRDHDERQTREALRDIMPFLHSRLAQQLVTLAFSGRGLPLICHLLHASDYHFRQGSTCDMTSSRLVFASVLYRLGQYEMCVRLLEQIDAELNPRVPTLCLCRCGDGSYRSASHVPEAVFSAACCVTFLSSEKSIAPPPLPCEIYRSVDTPPGSRDEKKDYWYDCAVVDGRVFLYYLKFLAYSKMDRNVHKLVAIDNLRLVIETDRNLGHRETAFNLLGYIYILENRIQDGVQCFISSWNIKPIHNAAKWHLRGVVNSLRRT